MSAPVTGEPKVLFSYYSHSGKCFTHVQELFVKADDEMCESIVNVFKKKECYGVATLSESGGNTLLSYQLKHCTMMSWERDVLPSNEEGTINIDFDDSCPAVSLQGSAAVISSMAKNVFDATKTDSIVAISDQLTKTVILDASRVVRIYDSIKTPA